MKLLTLICCIVMSSFCVFSQSGMKDPGYLGRRILLELNANFSFSNANRSFQSGLNTYDGEQEYKNFRVGVQPELSVGLFLSNNVLFGFEFSYLRHKFYFNNLKVNQFPLQTVTNVEDYTNYDLAYTEEIGQQAYDYYSQNVFVPSKKEHIKNVFSVSTFFEFFTGRRLTPFKLGHRFSFGTVLSKAEKIDDFDGVLNYGFTNYNVKIPNKLNYFWKLGYSLNRRFVLTKGFYINAGLSFNVILNTRESIRSEDNFSWYYNNYVYTIEKQFLSKTFLFQIKIGVGKI